LPLPGRRPGLVLRADSDFHGAAQPLFGVDAHVGPREIAPIGAITILVPIVAGMLVRYYAPGFADRIVGHVSRIAFLAKPKWNTVGNGVLLVFAAFSLVGLAVGHLLGGNLR
jgi:bile acid:Na+ symporter, BASS family